MDILNKEFLNLETSVIRIGKARLHFDTHNLAK